MTKQRQFYEPEVQVQQATPIRGFPVTVGGLYVLFDDVITVLREYAQTLETRDAETVYDLVIWLQSGERPMPSDSDEADHVSGLEVAMLETLIEQTEPISAVNRVEVFSTGELWYARALAENGELLYATAGSVEQAEAIQEAQNRWPGKDVHLVTMQPDTQGIDRIEIYPDDPRAMRPKWVARACSEDGDILSVTNGSFDQEYVIRDAQQRWPGKECHLVTHAGIDTVWEERDPGGIRSSSSGDRRPSPKRMFA